MQRPKNVSDPKVDPHAAEPVRLHLLGAPHICYGTRSVPFRGRPKIWPLLALLALKHGQLLEREAVACALWPDASAAAARTNLRRHLAYLGELLAEIDDGCDWLWRSATQVGIHPDFALWVDARVFLAASFDDVRLAEAVQLYGGDFLTGIDDEWVETERGRFRDRYVYALERLTDLERRRGNSAAALAYGQQALRVDPFREDLVRTLMRLRFACGDRAGAIYEYERFAANVREELGAEPAAETARLAAALRQDEPAPPELPSEETSFVGRRRELEQLENLFAQARLISIVGPPGVGKTRLARRFAARVAERFRDGVRLVDLTSVNDTETLLRVMEEGLEEHQLLVLDNCEHVAETCASIVQRMLRGAPHLRVIATSRVVLDVPGEATFRLDPLESTEALRLFIERARLAHRGFTPDALGNEAANAIVRGTDGLPLALELAAARLRTLTLVELVARLRRPMRLFDALRTSLESSLALLDPQERRLFLRLAVFRGGATLDAVRVVALDGCDEWTALRLVSRLVDRSLVVAPRVDAPEQRYELLQSIAAFAREGLAAGEDEAVAAAHARYFGRRYAELDSVLRGPRAHDHYAMVARDYEDLRAALERLVTLREDPILGMRLALALSRYWFDRGLVFEGATWLEAGLAFPGLPAPWRAKVLHCLATLIRNQGDYQRAFELFGQALEALRPTGDEIAIGKALATYSNAARMVGANDLARSLAEEAYATFAAVGDAYLCAYALLTGGCAAYSRGDVEAAYGLFVQALERYRSCGAEADVALALGNLAECAYVQGDLTGATVLASESVERARAVENVYFVAQALHVLARVALDRGDVDEARKRLREVVDLARSLDDKDLLLGTSETIAKLVLTADAATAATILGAVNAARRAYNVPRSLLERNAYECLAAAVAAGLSDEVYAAALRAGSALAPHEAAERGMRLAARA